MEKNFSKVRSMRDIIIVLIVIMFGFGFTIMPAPIAFKITGIFITIAGIILAFTLKTAYIDKTTGEIYSKKERFFSQSKHENLRRSLACPSHFCSKGENDGNTLRLDVYYNHNKIFIQLLEYVPYTYEPCSQFYEHDINTGSKFIQN